MTLQNQQLTAELKMKKIQNSFKKKVVDGSETVLK